MESYKQFFKTDPMYLLVKCFDDGRQMFYDGKLESDMPTGLNNDEKRYWLGGFRNAEHQFKNPCISVDEYHKVIVAAERAGREDRANGITRKNPYCPETDSERNDIWLTVYFDGMHSAAF